MGTRHDPTRYHGGIFVVNNGVDQLTPDAVRMRAASPGANRNDHLARAVRERIAGPGRDGAALA
jgi:hypothetical protein